MKNNNIYHDTGETLFKHGHSIFLNLNNESVEPHLHVHDFIEISYVASGCGIHIIGDKEYEVGKGDLFLINYHIPHEFRSLATPSGSPLQVYNCVFKPEFIDINLIDDKNFSDVIHYLSFRSLFSLEENFTDDQKILSGENPALETIFKKMLEEFTKEEDGYVELLRVYLIELLIKIFRSLKKADKSEATTMQHHANLIKRSMQYLDANYCVNAKLNDLAAQSFLSPTYFCKLFKDYAGITVSEYIQKLRMEEACNLLATTEDKIILIAQKVGYRDIKYFNEVFKKLTGTTPSTYRKSFQN